MKSTIFGIQNILAKINIRLDITEENIREQETNYPQWKAETKMTENREATTCKTILSGLP